MVLFGENSNQITCVHIAPDQGEPDPELVHEGSRPLEGQTVIGINARQGVKLITFSGLQQ